MHEYMTMTSLIVVRSDQNGINIKKVMSMGGKEWVLLDAQGRKSLADFGVKGRSG